MKESNKIRLGLSITIISSIIGLIFEVLKNYQATDFFLCLALGSLALTTAKPVIKYDKKIRSEEAK
jgi:hypothetical protein